MSNADWRTAVDRATRSGVELVLAESVRTTWQELRLETEHPSAQWAANHLGDDAQRRALASYRRATLSSWGSEGWGTLPALSQKDRVRFIAGLALPSRASRRNRGRGVCEHIRRGVGVVRRTP